MSSPSSLTMRFSRLTFTAAIVFLATSVVAEPVRSVAAVANDSKPDTDMFALMTGRCSTLKIAGRDFACKTIGFFHGEEGRTNFTIALDDPADDSHVISFSGENGQRSQDNLYELPVDQVLLSSSDRPKVDGLPVPAVEPSAGFCRQLGNFATAQLSSISCTATDRNGKKYELQFESDGSPMTVRRVKQAPLASEKRRARQIAQRDCRHKAAAAMVMPRDWTGYMLQCLGEEGQKPGTATDQ